MSGLLQSRLWGVLMMLSAAGGCITAEERARQMVVNSKGVESAVNDRQKCETRLRDLADAARQKRGNVDMAEARRLYERARVAVDGWIEGLKTGVDMRSTLDVSEAQYREGTDRAAAAFLSYRSEDVKGGFVAAVVVDVLMALLQSNAETEAAAKGIVKSQLEQARWRGSDAVLGNLDVRK